MESFVVHRKNQPFSLTVTKDMFVGNSMLFRYFDCIVGVCYDEKRGLFIARVRNTYSGAVEEIKDVFVDRLLDMAMREAYQLTNEAFKEGFYKRQGNYC